MAGLLDFLQSASNAAASNVSGPVELLTLALRKLGVPVPEDALGSSQWMERQGLTRKVPQGAASLAGETAGLLAPIAAVAKAPQIAKGLLSVADNAGDAGLNAARRGQMGATVWHGSPHKFDKFDSSKIGTGEGAQAYGHGLYLADVPEVAKQYRRMADVRLYDKAGREVPFKSDVQWVAKDLADAGNDYEKVAASLEEHGKLWPWPAGIGKRHLSEWKNAGVTAKHEGALYKVDLPDEHIAKMLDWDKPLSQQEPEVRDVLNRVGRAPGPLSLNRVVDDMRGSDFGKLLNTPEGTEALRQAGIPGIKYLDGVSRGAGEGSRNYVVFPGNEHLLNILERNGIPIR